MKPIAWRQAPPPPPAWMVGGLGPKGAWLYVILQEETRPTFVLVVVQVAVAVSRSEAVLLQVPPDAEPGPLEPALTLQFGLVHRVGQTENPLAVVLGGGAAAAVGRCGLEGGDRLLTKGRNRSKQGPANQTQPKRW